MPLWYAGPQQICGFLTPYSPLGLGGWGGALPTSQQPILILVSKEFLYFSVRIVDYSNRNTVKLYIKKAELCPSSSQCTNNFSVTLEKSFKLKMTEIIW